MISMIMVNILSLMHNVSNFGTFLVTWNHRGKDASISHICPVGRITKMCQYNRWFWGHIKLDPIQLYYDGKYCLDLAPLRRTPVTKLEIKKQSQRELTHLIHTTAHTSVITYYMTFCQIQHNRQSAQIHPITSLELFCATNMSLSEE